MNARLSRQSSFLVLFPSLPSVHTRDKSELLHLKNVDCLCLWPLLG